MAFNHGLQSWPSILRLRACTFDACARMAAAWAQVRPAACRCFPAACKGAAVRPAIVLEAAGPVQRSLVTPQGAATPPHFAAHQGL